MTDRLIQTDADRTLLVRFITNKRLPFRAVITDGRPRSLDQNRTWHMWANEAAPQRGMSPIECQADWKLRHGAPMLCAENAEFARDWGKISAVLPWEMQLLVMQRYEVTSRMLVNQLKRFMDDVRRECLEQGIALTAPEEAAHGPKEGSRVDWRDTRRSRSADRKTAPRPQTGRKVR